MSAIGNATRLRVALLVGMTLFVTVAILGSLVGCGGTATTTTVAAAATTATTTPSTTTTTMATTTTTMATTTTTKATTTTEKVTTTTEAVALYPWGAPAEVDGLRITVSETVWDKSQYVYYVPTGERSDEYKVLTTKVVLENVTDAPHIYSADYFKLTDTEGNGYTGNDEDDVSYSKHTAMRSGYLDPGKKITRWVTFITPSGAAGESISYSKDGSFGNNVQALWQE